MGSKSRKEVVYRKEYTIRKVGDGGVQTIIPKVVIERAARKEGLSVEEFIKRYKIVHLFNDFEDAAALYRFAPKDETDEINVPIVE